MININEDYDPVPKLRRAESNTSEGGCTSCRKKVAQETFNTVALNSGGYVPSIQNNYVNTPNVLEVLNGNSSYSNHMLNPNDFSERPNSGIGTGLDDRIDPLKPKGPFLPGDREPCQRDSDGNFYFPGNKFFPEYYLKESFNSKLMTDNCILSFDPDRVLEEGEMIKVNISHCCRNLVKDIWCCPGQNTLINLADVLSGRYQGYINKDCIYKSYDKFINCVRDKVERIIKFKLTEWKVPNEVINDYYKKILDSNNFDDFLTKIFYDGRSFEEAPQEILNIILRNDQNFNSCLCNDEGKPTYCCYPEENPDECYCPDGSLRNLCGDCEEEEFLFHIPIAFETQRYPSYSCFAGDWFENEEGFSCTVKIKNLFTNEKSIFEFDLKYLIDSNVDIGKKIIPLKLNPKEKYEITIIYNPPCGFCCKDKNTKRIFTRTIDVDLSSINDQELSKFLETAFGDYYFRENEDTGCVIKC